MKKVKTVRVIIENEGLFLMLQKTENSKNPGAWEFPGGVIENEDKNSKSSRSTASNAAVREAFEETGIRLTHHALKDLKLNKEYSFKINGKKNEREVTYFFVSLKDKPLAKVNSKNSENDKHKAFKWFDVDQYNFIKNYSKENPDQTFNTIAENSRIQIEDVIKG